MCAAANAELLLCAARRFAEAVFGVYQEGDVVWVQDYHLMLLPALLKKQKPKMKVCCTTYLAGWRFPQQ